MHQGSVLSFVIPAVGLDVETELARECVFSALLYANDLVMLSETIKRLRNNLIK